VSFKYLNWAWELPCKTNSEKLVALALADHADDNGFCFPSHRRLTHRCGLAFQSITDALKSLEDRGLVVACRKFGAKNQYVICADVGETAPAGRAVQRTEPLQQVEHDRSSSWSAPLQQVERNRQEPSVNRGAPPRLSATERISLEREAAKLEKGIDAIGTCYGQKEFEKKKSFRDRLVKINKALHIEL